MKRKTAWVILAIAAVAGIAVLVMTKQNAENPKGENMATGQQADAGGTKKACDVFTQDIAKQVLGDQAAQSDASGSGQASSDDISVSTCLYEVGSGRSVTIATLLVRGAKKAQAYQSNSYGFQNTRDQGTSPDEKVASEKLSGLGDDAYFNPSTKQVNVLVNKGQYWIIVQVTNDQAAAEKLAHAVVSKL